MVICLCRVCVCVCVCVYTSSLSIILLIDGQVISIAWQCTLGYMCLFKLVFSFVLDVPGVEMLGHMVVLVLVF